MRCRTSCARERGDEAWEEDEALFIRTELCALGSFSRFLWEFGRRFERLDEGRVWKIAADLSSVRPLSPSPYSPSYFPYFYFVIFSPHPARRRRRKRPFVLHLRRL